MTHRSTIGCVRLSRWWMAFDRATARQEMRHCDAVLARLDVPAPFDLDVFCQAVERTRSRRLVVTTLPSRLSSARSMWCPGDDTDHILVTPGWPRLHREHLVLHGIGHMLFAHTGAPAVAHLVDEVLADVDTAGVLRQSRRIVYTAREEFQAEIFATHVHQLAGRWNTVGGHHNCPSTSSLRAALSSVLEHQPRHVTSTNRREAHNRSTAGDNQQRTRRDASVEG